MFVSIVGKVNFASVSKLDDSLSLNEQISVHTTFVLLVLLGIRLFIAVVLYLIADIDLHFEIKQTQVLVFAIQTGCKVLVFEIHRESEVVVF